VDATVKAVLETAEGRKYQIHCGLRIRSERHDSQAGRGARGLGRFCGILDKRGP
jgi:hypothetical protein